MVRKQSARRSFTVIAAQPLPTVKPQVRRHGTSVAAGQGASGIRTRLTDRLVPLTSCASQSPAPEG